MEKRTILWYMVFWGFAINYMIRMNINIAIVSMIKHSVKTTNATTTINECPIRTVPFTSNNTIVQQPSMELDNDDKFVWNEYEQNAILGAFSLTHIVMQIPGGVLAQRYGTKTVFGLCNGLSAILSVAIPVSAKNNYKTLVVVRLLQGLISGGSWPSMHTMTAKWIPAHERSRFVSAYLGSSMGTAVTYIMCGYLIASFGWESVFYVSGGFGFVWLICWILFVYDTPAKHPTISIKEKTYIESYIGNTIHTTSKRLTIPWKSLLLSKPLFINLLTQFGGIWGLFTLTTQGPTYFNFVLRLNIKQTGLWSGMPHLFRWLFSFGFGTICDHLVKTKMMSMTNVRKLATFFCNIVQGFFILGLCFSGCSSVVAVIMLISATAVNGAISSGALAAAVDLAPNYAGVIQGIIGCFCTTSGFISPIIVGYLTLNQQTLSQWNKVFYLSGAICISSGLIYIFFGTSSVQEWNTYENPDLDEREMKLTHKKSKKRTILWYMTFWGFGMNFMLRMNLNIAIVYMVKKTTGSFNRELENGMNEKYSSSNTSISINTGIDNNNIFEWDEHQQNVLKGAFFWLHMILQIPCGLLTQKYSAKTIYGISNGVVSLLTCAIPFSAKYSFNVLVLLRIIQGIIAGLAWPSMQSITGKWIPPHERSRFVSAYLGISVGTAVTYMLGGYFMNLIGWEGVFYATGIIGLIWYGFWIYLICDSPESHPTISEKERKYILDSLGNSVVKNRNLKTPWKSIFTSVPFNLNVISQIGYNWGMYTLSLQAPTYFKFVLGFNMEQTGFWSGLPHLIIWPFSFIFGWACDHMIKNNVMSTTKVRKLACFSSNILHGMFILLVSFSGNNDVFVIFNMTLAVVLSGAISSGALPGIVDLAPNYAGVLQGINGTIVCSFVSISPFVVGLITYQQQTIEQWKKVFIVSAVFSSITGVIYIVFGSSKLQKWNNAEQKEKNEIKPISIAKHY